MTSVPHRVARVSRSGHGASSWFGVVSVRSDAAQCLVSDGHRLEFPREFWRDAPLPSNAPMSGAGARSAEASAPLAG
jgi:hypothetical protein